MTLLERLKKRRECIAIVDPELEMIAAKYKTGDITEDDLPGLINPIEEKALETTGISILINPVPVPGEYLGFEFKFPE